MTSQVPAEYRARVDQAHRHLAAVGNGPTMRPIADMRKTWDDLYAASGLAKPHAKATPKTPAPEPTQADPYNLFNWRAIA